MLPKISLLATGALIGLSAMTFPGTASAAGIPLSAPVATQPNVVDGFTQVAERRGERRLRDRWDWRRDGRRCSKRFGNCRHFYRGYYYETPWWTLPLIVGGGIALNNAYDDERYGDSHVEWCLDRYRSYDPRTNTWVSYSGNVNQCISPYS